MRWYVLLLSVLGVWRVTHLLHAEDGPAAILVRLRRVAGSGFWGGLLDCFYCLSLWTAAPFAWLAGMACGAGLIERLLMWPALSAGAILMERVAGAPGAVPANYWREEDTDVLLREETFGDIGAEQRRAG